MDYFELGLRSSLFF